MWIDPRHLVRLALLLAWLCAPLAAQNDAVSRRAAIEAIYPVMIRALEEKNFGRARNICDQAILWEPQNPVHHYNLACIEAQAGGSRLPYAWGALDLAIALGFNDARHLQNDPDLAPLRSDPRFADLVRKVMFNVSAGDAIAGLRIPTDSAKSAAGSVPETAAERPPPAGFERGLPVGLYFASRYHATTQPVENAAWYFAPDGTVYQNLEHGFSRADLSAHAGPRGKANLTERTLEITWADGAKTRGEIERDGDTFTWDMGIFVPVTPFEDAADAAGIYEASGAIVAGTQSLRLAQRLELHPDGTFTAEGMSFGDPAAASVPKPGNVSGRWELQGLSLTLRPVEGAAIRRIAFPDDDSKTVVKPDRMFFAGLVYKRRP